MEDIIISSSIHDVFALTKEIERTDLEKEKCGMIYEKIHEKISN